MRRLWFPLWFSLWPCFLGVFLPYLAFPGGVHLLNLFWESVYGLGLWGIDETVGLSIESRLLVLGLFVWPIILSTLMFKAGRALLKDSLGKIRLPIVIALIASSFIVIANPDRVGRPPFSRLPTYYRLFSAVW